ncbi:MAG: hypothetical protein AAGJ82_04695 [Bacteroidota bacterium]
MTPKDYLTTIRDAVRQDKLNLAFQLLQEFVAHTSEELKEVIAQSGRYAAIEREVRLGTVDGETASVEKNKIRWAVLDFLTALEVAEMEHPTVKAATRQAMSRPVFQQHANNIYNIEKIEGGATFN